MPCPICRDGPMRPRGEFPVEVCEECDQRAVNADGETPWIGYPPEKQAEMDESSNVAPPDDGENPVFIDGHKCWRRYRFGGWITFLDHYDCDTLDEFYVRHGLMEPRESRQRITSDDRPADPKQSTDPGSSSVDHRNETPADDSPTDDIGSIHSGKNREKLRNLIIQGIQIDSESETTDSEIQHIANLVGEPPWSQLAIKYLAMLAADEPEEALEALPIVASSYTAADKETQQWIMYYFSALSKTHPDALFPVLDTLIDGATGDSTKVQSNALAALGRIVSAYPNVGSGLVDELAELLVHENPMIRKNAVGLLGDTAQEYQRHVVVHAATIAACLTDEEPHVRRNASIALVRCGEADPEAIREQRDWLEHALTDDQSEVRKNACVLIGNAQPTISTETLERLAEQDPHAETKEMAQWALDQITS